MLPIYFWKFKRKFKKSKAQQKVKKFNEIFLGDFESNFCLTPIFSTKFNKIKLLILSHFNLLVHQSYQMQSSTLLDKYGRPLPPKRGEYYVPSITTDAIVFLPPKSPSPTHVLLITRGHDPFKGLYAFPGGFLEYNETPEEGCLRELLEETNLKGNSLELLTVSGDPLKDPRGHTVSVIYLVEIEENAKPVGGDDAAKAEFYKVEEMVKKKEMFAFDHYELLMKALEKMKRYEKI